MEINIKNQFLSVSSILRIIKKNMKYYNDEELLTMKSLLREAEVNVDNELFARLFVKENKKS